MKTRHFALLSAVAALAAVGLHQPGRSQDIPHAAAQGWFDFKAPVMKDPVLQQAKETYIQHGCAYCHGVDVRPRGEAADLMHSAIVGADTDGAVISQILKAGIPQTAKLSPMPQFSDLSDSEMKQIARWIHYARMKGRFTELMAAPADPPADVAAGKAFYAAQCSGCHAPADLQRTLSSVKPADLKAFVLKPALLERPISFVDSPRTAAEAKGRSAHSHLLETLSAQQAADLVGYLRSGR